MADTPSQLRRIATQSANRMGYESGMIQRYLTQVGFTKQKTDYLAKRSQVAPKEVIRKIEAKMPKDDKGKIIESELLGKVKRCVNNINQLNRKWASASKKLETMPS